MTRKFGRRGQGAMEYLMTYGWAILVVMLVGVALWQMGLFEFGGTIPTRVSGFNYQKPIDATLEFSPTCANGVECVRLSMVNGEPGKITVTVAPTGTVNSVTLGTCTPAASATVNQGAKYEIICLGAATSPTLVTGEVATVELQYTYTVAIAGRTRTRTEDGQGRGPVD